WNFVVLGLLAVLLLPVAEGWGRPRLNGVYIAFLAATLAVGLLNYLPTRLSLAAVWIGMCCAVGMWRLAAGGGPLLSPSTLALGRLALALSPWIQLAVLRGQPGTEFDRLCLGFRDRFGLVWGKRLLEQFNRAAENAGWPVILRWHGLRRVPGTTRPDEATQ